MKKSNIANKITLKDFLESIRKFISDVESAESKLNEYTLSLTSEDVSMNYTLKPCDLFCTIERFEVSKKGKVIHNIERERIMKYTPESAVLGFLFCIYGYTK